MADIGEAFRRLRTCYPSRRLFVIMDNQHNVPAVRNLLRAAPRCARAAAADRPATVAGSLRTYRLMFAPESSRW